MSPTTVSSCPGKVLLAGGYLVLDPSHQGFVLSTPSRFYTVVHSSPPTPASSGDDGQGDQAMLISVKSPQFEDGAWLYDARREVGGEWELDQRDKQKGGNAFVQLSIASTLLLASALAPVGCYSNLDITIVGSNDFYSQPRDGPAPIAFAPLGCTIKNVHKTGLGSSAAMVTSLTSTLLQHLVHPSTTSASSSEAGGRPALPDHTTLQLMHNLAQYVHSLAQGKVGSGFDVSAALWGSQVYRRFAVECLGSLLEGGEKPTAQKLLNALSPQLNVDWAQPATAAVVTPFALPPGLVLLLADVDSGSNTPSMVGKVLAWKKAKPVESEQVWEALRSSNAALAATFADLAEEAASDPVAYAAKVVDLAGTKSSEWTGKFAEVVERVRTTRGLMRRMGEESDVPIEPKEQERLLDACSELPGVVGAGVPGAGGYDAIWVLALAPAEPATAPVVKVEELLNAWEEMSVRPLSKSAWIVGGKEEGERGLLRETLEEVPGLKEAVAGWA